MFRDLSRPSWAAALGAVIALAVTNAIAPPLPALAANAYLTGRVVYEGKPVASAVVTATGNNIEQTTKTDAQGDFRFSTLAPGSYTLAAVGQGGSAKLFVDLPAAGATVTMELVTKIGSVTATAARTASIRGSGTDLVLNAAALSRSPASSSFPEMLIQLPGAARGANGVVHINGDHGDINYIVDGVSVPQALNRVIGTEFNPGNAAFIDVIQGAYPAQYGERFATVLNISTRTNLGVQRPGASLELDGGSFGTYDATLGYHDRVGNGALVLAIENGVTDRGLDPPQQASVHNQASNSNQFLRYTLPLHNDYLNLTVSHSYNTFQIPNATNSGQPASSDDNETQDDTFAALVYRHPIGDRGALTFGGGYKRSDIRDFGDPLNDWI
ncbi:MAG: TonB-dependent receptor, partial [Candidatus Eremiobacteraeota bacterium]|nr:TonB-dependent receptor [Candidatus Eremiobacteraeota bacterium]